MDIKGLRFTYIGIRYKGGPGDPGSGHHGHVGIPGQVGGSLPSGVNIFTNPTLKQQLDWEKNVAGWEGERRAFAKLALRDIKEGNAIVVKESKGELKGIASISIHLGKNAVLSVVATKERGHGLDMMRAVIGTVAAKGQNIWWEANAHSLKFYKAIGFKPLRDGQYIFKLSAEECEKWMQRKIK